MQVNIDTILNKLLDWDLTLTVGGKTFSVEPPSNAVMALFAKVHAGEVVAQDIRANLEAALAPLIADATVDIKSWDIKQLLASVTAVIIHTKQAAGKNLAGIVPAVIGAMQAPAVSTAPAIPAEIPPAPQPQPATPAAPAKAPATAVSAPAAQPASKSGSSMAGS
jgi:hypothetical protein